MNQNPCRSRAWLLALLLTLPLIANGGEGQLRNLAGGQAVPTELLGKGDWLVMMFWSAHCGVCQQEAPLLEKFQTHNRAANVRVLGISVDGEAEVDNAQGFVREHGLTFMNLLAEGEDAALLFQDATGDHMIGTPAFLVFAPDGALRAYRHGTINFATLQQLVETNARRVADARRDR